MTLLITNLHLNSDSNNDVPECNSASFENGISAAETYAAQG
jgi:hypothetical protein